MGNRSGEELQMERSRSVSFWVGDAVRERKNRSLVSILGRSALFSLPLRFAIDGRELLNLDVAVQIK